MYHELWCNEGMYKMYKFFSEVRSEINNATWPKRDELIGSTVVVFILVLFFAVLLGAVDSSFSYLIENLFESR